jgi:hypothetical protein
MLDEKDYLKRLLKDFDENLVSIQDLKKKRSVLEEQECLPSTSSSVEQNCSTRVSSRNKKPISDDSFQYDKHKKKLANLPLKKAASCTQSTLAQKASASKLLELIKKDRVYNLNY